MIHFKSHLCLKYTCIFLISFLIISCGGSGGGANTSSKLKVSGKITFERVPYTKNGLDFANISELPVRRCLVKIFSSGSTESIDSIFTDENGDYSFLVQEGITVYITVFSISTAPVITVKDNNGIFSPTKSEPYKFSSEPLKISQETKIDLNATCGNPDKGKKYTKERLASSFAIIDTCQKSTKFFLDKRPNIVFPDLLIYWSKSNSESAGIGTGY